MASQPSTVIRVKPHHFIHVLDNNTNVTRVEVGPQTFTRQDHERVLHPTPLPMILIPPRNYCIIDNPIIRKDGVLVVDQFNQPKLRHGDQEIRFSQDPFPLYPGEVLIAQPVPLQVIQANSALRLKCLRDFVEVKADKTTVSRTAGDEWLFEGPGTYYPRVEVTVIEPVKAVIIKENQALKLRARLCFTDRKGSERQPGEEWLVRESGAYLPGVHEEIVGFIQALVLTDRIAYQLLALRSFIDCFGKARKAGEEWIITQSDCDTYIPDVNEKVVRDIKAITLTNRQYCIVENPVDKATGKNKLGHKQLLQGDLTFFLLPGESLVKGIQNVNVLSEDEALLLSAKEEFVEKKGKETVVHKPGDLWMIYGPCDYIPPIQVDVVERRKRIPLDVNEGIYVRDIKTGKVRSVHGSSYMLLPNEERWAKPLSPIVDELLNKSASRDVNEEHNNAERDPTKVVTYRVPHNAAVQIFDYRKKEARVIFGPELVMLEPDEEFTVLSLSGKIPKRPNHIRSLALFLGPDFMTDLITVETADHARLSLKLSYNWHFKIEPKNPSKLFATSDFTGDLCKATGSLVRAAVAASTFDNFHKHSSDIIQTAVFGKNKNGESNDCLYFETNGLVITNIDVQSVEPVDQRTLDSLQKSVQLAIEITTKSQEATARQEAERLEQMARGELERQKIVDEARAEESRAKLVQLQAQSAAVESTGQAVAEARARAEAAIIEAESEIKHAKLSTKATEIESNADLETIKAKRIAELEHVKALNDLEVVKARELAAIEISKFENTVNALGSDTICAISNAGPEMQAKLLGSLNLSSVMITDGSSPVNLFNTANGLIGNGVNMHE
ncbi:major vault protein beta (MVP-beta) [Dictyostelium purpureum]|uniref:Major vault protein beta (MVP-beta) n=1 Tax=Dictyostelium purpureum TaxID=5786 RepID=F0ZAW1_DICPU|nr:major vault protein beta (MVP-beta) [Dictyostelium purpureum]EGC38895.1 major vault protein beta (MVP-beta) [Dictyostelium purpureum]|eukprot:XP_003284575.1 major vault protein beta (MVP-beta) [Dictyostelium purpureum]